MTTSSASLRATLPWRLARAKQPNASVARCVANPHARTPQWAALGRRAKASRKLCALGLVLLVLDQATTAAAVDAVPPDAGTSAQLVAIPSTGAVGSLAAAPYAFDDDEFLINDVFQSHLPRTLQKYALRLSVHPHLGDFQNKDHLRMTTSLRYGLTENWEISTSSNLYFSHGFGEIRSFENYGAANLHLGSKFNLGQTIVAGWETGAGFDFEIPLGHPPTELTDGLRHFTPYVTFSHRLELHPDVRLFWGARLNQVTHTSVAGEFGKNALQASSTGLTGGWVIDRNNWHYTFEASYDTTRLISHSAEDLFTIRPGVMWEIPTRRNPQVKSHWVVGVAANCTYGPGGSSLGGSFKLRYSRDLKNRFHRRPVAPVR